MTEKIEYKGYWYLPSNPDKAVAGILTYIPTEEIVLELIGTFDSDCDPLQAFMDKQEEPIIQGVTSDAKEVTLVNCYPSGSVNLSCPFPIVRYNCQYIIIGKHLHDFDQKSFYKAYIRIPQLTHWCHPGAIRRSIRFDKTSKRAKEIQFVFGTDEVEKPINLTEIDGNTSLSLMRGVDYNGSEFFLTPKIEQYTYLKIEKKTEESIRSFLSAVYMYEQFLSLATLQTIKCAEISLFDRSVYQELSDGEKHYHPIRLIYIQRNTTVTSRQKKHDSLFDYKLIEKQYQQVLRKWYLEKNDIAPIRAHLLDSIASKGIFSSIDFLVVIQAIEGFWWRFRDAQYKTTKGLPRSKQTELKTIVAELKTEFISIDRVKAIEWEVDSIVDSRHYYSHFMNKSRKPQTLDGRELYELTHKLRKLLICCLLHFVGFDYSQINDIVNQSNSNLIR